MAQQRLSKFFSRLRVKNGRRHSRVTRFEQLERRELLAAAVWNNVLQPVNVNGDIDGVVSGLDALLIINEINNPRFSDAETGALPRQVGQPVAGQFLDVTCDGIVSPVDVLQVVNHINNGDSSPARGGKYPHLACSPQLLEGNAFSTELSQVLKIPDDSTAVRVFFQAPEFDFSTRQAIRDAFEIEVTDTSGNPIAFPYLPGRDALYNWSEDLEPLYGAGTETTTEPSGQDSSATINLAGLPAGTEVKISARLVNNDADNNTSVLIRGFEIIAAASPLPRGVPGTAGRVATPAPVDMARLDNLTSSFAPSYGHTTLAGDNNELITELMVTNRGNQTVTGQIIVVIDNISELDAAAMHPDGILRDGRPYFDLTHEMQDKPLAPGESLHSREIRFKNNSGQRFTYKLSTYGSLNAAPNGFSSTPVDSIEAGKRYKYTAVAVDPDGQALSYSMVAGPEAASMDAATGELTWATSIQDIGSHTITIVGTDPHGLSVEQTFVLQVVESQQNRPPNFVSDPVTDAIASSGFEITTVATGASPAGIDVISGFRGPRLVSINADDQTVGVYSGERNDRFDDAKTYATGFPAADGQLFDVGYSVDIGLPQFRANDENNNVFGLDQGDLNGDGILDLVALYAYDAPSVGQRYQLVISAMLGDGDGGFGSPAEIYRHNIGSSGYDVRNLLLRDVNGDGSLDVLAVERQRSPRLITILGHGDGTFDAAVEQTFTKSLSDFRAADIDEDGKLDLIGRTASLGFGASYEAVWLKGNGDGTFGEPIVIGSAGGDPGCCYQTQQRPHDVLDLNGDDNLDIAFLTGAGVVIYHSDGNGNFTQASGVTPTTAFARDWIRGGDFNGDGIADLVYHHSSRLEVLLGTGDGVNFTYQRGPETDALLSNYAGTDDPRDVDGDGDLDLIFGHSSGDWTSTKVAINDGAGNFSVTEYAMVDFSGDIRPFSAGDIARGAMFGDYNRDGVVDFSYFTSGGDFNGVGIRLGTRPGEFGQTRTIPWLPGTRSEEALPGDYNGDGIVDLLDTMNNRIFLGIGDGTYQAAFPSVSVSRPTGFGSSADFNLDGIDDFVSTRANTNGSRYYVALANGDGTFTVSDDQLVQSSFYGYSSTFIADFNLDGFPDFVAKSGIERQIDVHLNDPSNPGVFTRTFRITLPGGSQGINVSNWQESYAVADFTGDGIPDLAFAERDADTDNLMKLVVMAGDGLGDFNRHSELAGFDDSFIRSIYGATYYAPGDFSAGDLNSDGSVDLVSVTNAGTRVFINDGAGNFEFISLLENPGTEQRGRDSWLVDFDEDGQLDLIQTGTNGSGPLIVRLGNGDATFRKPQQVGLVGATPGSISRRPFADLDGDGHLDFVYATDSVGNYGSDTASIFSGRRDDLVDLLAVDLDDDGNEEILAIQEQMDRLQILVGDNLGGFRRQPDLLTGRAPQAVAAVDLDGDGKLELITANRASRSLSVFTGTIGAGYISTEFPVGLGPMDVATTDINGDGNQDVLVLDDATNALWLLLGDGSTTLGTPTAIALGDKPSRFSMADATGDGMLDAVVTLPDTQRLMILPGDGAGAFGSPIYVDLAAAPSDVAIVDLNNDGNPDLATTLTSLNVLSVLYGRGNNQFSRAQHIQVGDAPTRVTLADADEDGRFDFVVANSGDATASVIYNRFDPNEVYRYDADAIDPDDDALTYAIVDGPGGLIINSETGALLWAASPNQVGVHNVTISADDGRGGIATQSFKIDVVAARENAAPLIATEPQTTMGAGEAFAYQVTALDNDRDALRYRLIDAPPGATIDPTTGLIEWNGRGKALIYAPYGDSGAVAVPTNNTLTPASVTVEGWVNIHKLTASNGASVLFSLSGAGDWAYYLRTLFNNRFQLIMDFDGQRVDFQPRFQFTTDKWFHLALSIDDVAKTATIWVDGQVVGSTAIPNSIGYANGRTLYIGDNSQFKTLATFDNFRVWNVARNAAELQEGMAKQYENDPRLVLDYRFEDTRMLSVQDHSTYGNTGYRVSNGLLPQAIDGLTEGGFHTFSVAVEDGRGGYDLQTFELKVLPELRGSLVGHLFDDLDGDGKQDDGSENPAEPSLAGWHVYIDTNGNAYPDPSEPQATTDAAGNYRFDGMLPGDYPVRISPMAGYDVPTGATPVSVSANEDTAFDLAIEQLSLSHIRGQLLTEDAEAIAFWKVFADLDGDGTLDDIEPIAVTDRNGDYALTGLDAGTYTIRPVLAAGWADTAGRAGLSVTLAADEISADNDFMLKPTNTSVTGGLNFVTKPNTSIEARQTFGYASIAMGIAAETITYDLSLAPEGMTMDPSTGLVAWRPSIDQVGEHLVILRATGASGSIALHDFYLNVTAPNTPPVISGIGILPVISTDILPVIPTSSYASAFVGFNYAYDIIAQDAESTDLTYALTNAPAGATINATTGRLSWTPAASAVGSHEFTAEVADASGATTSVTWTVDVQSSTPSVLPLNISLPRSTAAVTTDYFSRIRASDAIGRPVTWSLTSGPVGLTAQSNGTLAWKPGASQLGPQSVELTATTADGNTEVVSFEIQVTGRALNAIPTIESAPLTSISLGQTFTYDVQVSDTDRDIHAFSLLEFPVGMSVHPSLGSIRWTPAADQLGETNVIIQVSDPSGDTATQEFKLKVSRFGGPPRITSVPPTEAGVGTAFLYSVVARDAEGDPLSYSLLAAPVGMSIVETTGELSWTPTANQLGQQDVVIQVSDGIGGAATQAFAIRVSDGVPNLQPRITTSSPRFGAVGTAYSYTLTATDPENTLITYSLGRGPAGMTVDANSGLVSWTPTAAQVGKFVVTLIATDAGGASAVESFEFDVLAQNSAPVINSNAPTEVAAGAVFMYDVLASDVDLDQLRFELVQAPVGAEIDSFGRIRWQTSVPLIGSHNFQVKVRDPRGGQAIQSFTLDVIEDLVPPKVSIIEDQGDGSRNILPWQGPFTVYVRAIDNVAVASLTLTANGKDIPLDAAGSAKFTFEEWTFQRINATATATDTNGNVTTKTISFDYDFPEGWSGAGTEDIPTATITSPTDTESVTGMVSIVGTAAHTDLFSYKLSYRHVDETSFTQFHESNTAVTNGALGVWDTSLLLNDEYVIRLEVATNAGVVNVVERHVGLAGELKLGNFRLSFTDMVIPVAGIPIEITRIYDTLQADRQGDFGYGWRLEYRNTDLRVGLPKSGLEDIGVYSALRPGVKVYLNVPGVGRQGFTFNPDIRVLPGFGGQNLTLARPRFTPDPGVTSTLSTGTSGYLQVNERGELYAPGGIPYNPASPNFGGAYVLTTREGITYRVDGANGELLSATDRNSNQVTFTDAGLSGADGAVQVAFQRDMRGRINGIVDPLGGMLTYTYSTSGDLTMVTDREGTKTELRYSSEKAHYLVEIIDPLDRSFTRQEYDKNGKLVKLFGVTGVAQEISYSPENFLVESKQPNGGTAILEYDNRGNVVAQTDALGATTLFEYDGKSQLIGETDSTGYRRSFSYDPAGRITSRTDPLGNTLRTTFATFDVLDTFIDPMGNARRYEYDEFGNEIIQVDPLGNQIVRKYDSRGNVTKIVDPLGYSREFSYDSAGRMARLVDSDATVYEYVYDGNGNLLERTQTDTRIGDRIVIRQEYSPSGRLLGVTDALGNTTRFEYDAIGQQTATVVPDGRKLRFEYGSAGLASTQGPDGKGSSLTYDNSGQLQEFTFSSGNTGAIEYDAVGRPIRFLDADGTPNLREDNPQLVFSYDSVGRLLTNTNAAGETYRYDYSHPQNLPTRTTAPDGSWTALEFDANGRPTSRVDGLNSITRTTYDEIGNEVGLTTPNGRELLREFDASGNLIEQIDENGRRTRWEYDAKSRLTMVVSSSGARTAYSYDVLGNLTEIKDANGNITRYEFNKNSQQTATVLMTNQREEFAYDLSGRMATHTDFSGAETAFRYDDQDRLLRREYSDGTFDAFTYNEFGKHASISDETGVVEFEYDPSGRMTVRREADSTETKYTYLPSGRLNSIETPYGLTAYAYNDSGLLSEVTSNLEATPTKYFYDDARRVIRIESPNGVIEQREYEQDFVSRVRHFFDEQTIADYLYSRSPNGLINRVATEDGETVEYEYSPSGHLITETYRTNDTVNRTIRYSYDFVGNRLYKSDSIEGEYHYTYDTNNQLVETLINGNRETYTYDTNGNLLQVKSNTGVEWSATWDRQNRLDTITTDDGNPVQVDYQYDPVGNLIRRETPEGSQRFLWNTLSQIPSLVAEYSDLGESQYYVQGLRPISQTSDQTLYFLNDAHSGVRGSTDASGKIVEKITYDAFGRTLAGDEVGGSAFGYRDYLKDVHADGYYLPARRYSPELGRFLNRDLIEGVISEPLTHNKYNYAHSDPINHFDPTGLFTLKEALIGLGITGLILNIANEAFKYKLRDLREVEWEGGLILASGAASAKGASALAAKSLSKLASISPFDFALGGALGFAAGKVSLFNSIEDILGFSSIQEGVTSKCNWTDEPNCPGNAYVAVASAGYSYGLPFEASVVAGNFKVTTRFGHSAWAFFGGYANFGGAAAVLAGAGGGFLRMGFTSGTQTISGTLGIAGSVDGHLGVSIPIPITYITSALRYDSGYS